MQRVASRTPGPDEGAGRAGGEAGGAVATLVESRRVRLEGQAGDEAPEKQPRPELGIDEAGILADPADARVLREDALLDGPGVDVDARLEGPGLRQPHPVEQGVEALTDDDVVIVAPGVAGDHCAERIALLV